MFHNPDYVRTVSLKLSEVLNDIDVNEKMILKRRRMFLLEETISTISNGLLGINLSRYYFGSQSEGSTTKGLKSDFDILICNNKGNVVHELNECQPGKNNLLMIQDETTSPGYCLLQDLHGGHSSDHTVYRGKLLLKTTYFTDVSKYIAGSVKDGPAVSRQGIPGHSDQDFVSAFPCKSWPIEAWPWLERQGIGKWPTEDMKRYCETTGCFIVPCSSKSGQAEQLEWRISTSQAERCLMFSLNITQIRCYILMKMILKAFINPQCVSVLSSFMCKTALFHCIQNTHSNNWRQSNLLSCLTCCLVVLQNFVRQENCPHFIIPENNLMAGRISPHNKHKVLKVLQNIIQSGGRKLLEIPIEDLGTRFRMKMNMDEPLQYYHTPEVMNAAISAELLFVLTDRISYDHKFLLGIIMPDQNERVQERLSNFMFTYTITGREIGFNSLEKIAFKLFTPLLSSSLGSVIASCDIYTTNSISQEALAWFTVGLDSDVSSCRLKLASALYCARDMEMAEFVLRNTQEKYDLNVVEPACKCHLLVRERPRRRGFINKCNNGNEELIKHITSFCIRFLQCEICCVPVELQYEMFRSTHEDMLERDELNDCWMNWAVVDSLPYLYFLLYKTYGALRRYRDQQHALAKLVIATETEPNLGHRETALNLLGQCMEQENRHTDALHCYMKSLDIRERNNAANFLICRLLNELLNMQ